MKYTIALIFVMFFANPSEEVDPNLTDEEIKILVDGHNKWRREVGVPDLEWSETLANSAAKWAAQLKKQNCAFKHSKSKYGENLFTGTSGYYDASSAVQSWGEEIKDYNYKKNSCKPGKMCGHYTQMVWKTTTKVGCAKVTCDGRDTWVCQYDPPGNYIGRKPY